MRYFIKFSYFGKNYHGWQIQPNAVTVQGELTKAVNTLLASPTELIGAGRTDSGVHAQEMYAHFDVKEPIDTQVLVKRLNAFLPKDIAVFSIFEVPDTAHARFDAIRRTYKYYIHQRKDAFRNDFSWHFYYPLDLELMNKACKLLFDHTDFECFSKSNTDVFTYNCTIYEAEWIQQDNSLIFSITADRFLRNMVRAVVGTLLGVGQHKMSLDEFEEVIQSKNRSRAGFSVPAQGLYLTRVIYPFPTDF